MLWVVWKVQVGLVVVRLLSLTVAYHSKVWPAPRLGQLIVLSLPDGMTAGAPIWLKLPLAYGRP